MLARAVKNGVNSVPVWALGFMSGTSADGVDAAMILTDGEEIFDFGPSAFRPYSKAQRATILSAMGKWPRDRETPYASEIVEIAHVQAFAPFSKLVPKVDVIGFHGQTLAHDPGGQGTHQAGDGRIIANALGVPVVWDFRTADVELGGQGAPLAPYFHFACAKWIGAKSPVAFVNLGGVGNITWVDPGKEAPDAPHALLAFDTGPANAPIDDYMREHFGKDYDENGAIAASGQVDFTRVEAFLEHRYFAKIPPKSLDRNSFTLLRNVVSGLSHKDAIATLTQICAASVAASVTHLCTPPDTYFITGGGRKNQVLMTMLREQLKADVVMIDDTGLDGDMLEAQAFAFLAVRVRRGLSTSCPSTTGVMAPVGGGLISKPQRR